MGTAQDSDAAWGATLGWDVPLTESAAADTDGWQAAAEGSLPELEGWDAPERPAESSALPASPAAHVEGQRGSGGEVDAIAIATASAAAAAATTEQAASPAPLPPADTVVRMWYYVDPSGSTQGPFSITQFHVWLHQLRCDAGMCTEYDELRDVSVWREGMSVRVPLPILVGPI